MSSAASCSTRGSSTRSAACSTADFWRDDHREIYAAILAVANAGRRPDVILVAEHLATRGRFTAIGGDDLFQELIDAQPHAANTLYHAQIVRQKSAQRALLDACAATLDEVYAGRQPIDELFRRHRERVAPAERYAGPRTDGEAVLVRLADVEPEPVRWLWPGRIPIGMLTLIAGDPGVGKSFLTCALAAAVSTGGGWPDEPDDRRRPASVVIMNAEDTLANTIRPRLDAAGADVRRIHSLTTVRRRDGTLAGFRLGADLPRLEEALDTLEDVQLLVVDPVSAYLGGQDEHKNAEVREILTPLQQLAERRGVAVVLITHMNKGSGGKRSTGRWAASPSAPRRGSSGWWPRIATTRTACCSSTPRTTSARRRPTWPTSSSTAWSSGRPRRSGSAPTTCWPPRASGAPPAASCPSRSAARWSGCGSNSPSDPSGTPTSELRPIGTASRRARSTTR